MFFFFNDTATTEIYTLSLHDALPISGRSGSSEEAHQMPPRRSRASAIQSQYVVVDRVCVSRSTTRVSWFQMARSEEHTSELQSRQYLVCRLLLEKKKKISHLAVSSDK